LQKIGVKTQADFCYKLSRAQGGARRFAIKSDYILVSASKYQLQLQAGDLFDLGDRNDTDKAVFIDSGNTNDIALDVKYRTARGSGHFHDRGTDRIRADTPHDPLIGKIRSLGKHSHHEHALAEFDIFGRGNRR